MKMLSIGLGIIICFSIAYLIGDKILVALAAAPAAREFNSPELHPLQVNTETWEVFSPDYSTAELNELNSLENRQKRAMAAAEILQPRKWNDNRGKSIPQIQAEAAAAFAITHPGVIAAQRPLTAEETDAYERAKASILNPR